MKTAKLDLEQKASWHIDSHRGTFLQLKKNVFVAEKIVARWTSIMARLRQFQNPENNVFTFEFAPNLIKNP
jgi:hypothetical protein